MKAIFKLPFALICRFNKRESLYAGMFTFKYDEIGKKLIHTLAVRYDKARLTLESHHFYFWPLAKISLDQFLECLLQVLRLV